MTSEMAMEDVEALRRQGFDVSPRDVIWLNGLGLKLEKRPDFRLASLPRVALCEGVMFVQPTIQQDMFLDEVSQLYPSDAGTRLALEAYVLSHRELDFSNPPRFPKIFAAKCAAFVRKRLGKTQASKVRQALDFVKFGIDPATGEKPVYMTDEKFSAWWNASIEGGTNQSQALKSYMLACTLGIQAEAAKTATSEQLDAMIERAWLLNDRQIQDEEKTAAAEYYKALDVVKGRSPRTEKAVDNG